MVKEFKTLSDWIDEVNEIPADKVKEFIKWIETEIILKSPKSRQNLIKLKKRVGEKLT